MRDGRDLIGLRVEFRGLLIMPWSHFLLISWFLQPSLQADEDEGSIVHQNLMISSSLCYSH